LTEQDGPTVWDPAVRGAAGCATTTLVPTPETPAEAARAAVELLRTLVSARGHEHDPVQLLTVLGEGGMAVVRLATQASVGRSVAVKTLRDDEAGPFQRLQLLREAWVTGYLEHPNIVPVHDVGLDDEGRPVVVLKRIAGTSWHDLLDDPARARQQLSVDDPRDGHLDVLRQVCDAVRFAHSRGIVHRDLKPANVMIGEFGEVYVLDWGVAVSLRESLGGRLPLAAEATGLAGTPAYLAPEMLPDRMEPVTERTDVYLLGATLYHVLTGRPPHAAGTVEGALAAVVRGVSPLADSVPAPLAELCGRALATDPAARLPDVAAFQRGLRQYARRRDSDRLAADGWARLREVEATLEGDEGGDPALEAERSRLAGEARFAFRQALARWPDSDEARRGQLRLLARLVDHELACGHARAAETLLGEVEAPPRELVERIETARRREDETRRDAAELARLAERYDLRRGSRSRLLLALVLGSIWTVSPLVVGLTPARAVLGQYGPLVTWMGGWIVALLAIALLARRALRLSPFTRRLLVLFGLSPVGIIVLATGATALGLGAAEVGPLILFFWASVLAAAAALVSAYAVPSAVGYAVAFGVAAAWPDTVWYAASAGTAVFTVNFAWLWASGRRLESLRGYGATDSLRNG